MAKFIGIDIGTSSIKVVVSTESKILKIGAIPNKFGKMLSVMSNTERVQLTDDLKKIFLDLGMKEPSVVASLPESLTFSKLMKFPRMSMPELATAIKWDLDQSVPFPPNEIESSWSVVDKNSFIPEDMVGAFVVAVPSKISELYVQLFELLGKEPLRLENESVPFTRAHTSLLNDSVPSFLIDIGASGTKIVLANKQMIFNSYFYSVGGSAMTKLISESFGLTADQAEQYKRTYGMVENQLDGKIFRVLKPLVDNLINEVRKMAISYKTDYGEAQLNKIILSGGGCYLMGLIPYMTSNLEGMEVSIGNVFENYEVDSEYVNLGPVFGLALGLSQ
jgi:type IV pilus assembly protein PilM